MCGLTIPDLKRHRKALGLVAAEYIEVRNIPVVRDLCVTLVN